MKIKINQNEIYEVIFNNEVSPRQFQELLIRLNSINKLIGRDPLLNQLSIKPETRKYRSIGAKRPWSKNRDEVVHIIKMHYLSDDKYKTKYAEKMGMVWDDITKSFHNLKRKWNITPEEIGVPFFPSRQDISGGKTIFELREVIDREGLKYIPDENREIIN